ncbi:hypothetical protein RBSWK_05368 [Rhodopirellula baltica SWK14]|uniref:Uncharacterized protein n=1 Tax=Rhodopirellula baltica SWK14 TaxID=993516 RepID=L7C8X3_RHOBT|nr:hypothetical protein RBSWK_05368 [Rhodopirellula baltica SWK14]
MDASEQVKKIEVRSVATQRGEIERWDMGGSLAGRVWREANKKADAKLDGKFASASR